ncbi:Predicted PurR-regulated permease PerM [Halorubrum aquaticum]|uniref:Predicted PurR-regulated permease PerM n=1 Tax=Halorubrum aquaticum TaxID=387340 RepID=A0A1I2ZFG1_9EURY|nr:AI-2E family transporter [Halorubrum aquaticum]SFH36464.1 Predicted PurR-regulated permease PerM [Halorubrum aquaticum]
MSDGTASRPSPLNGLSVLALASAVFAAVLIATYLQYVLLAVVIAYVLAPLQHRAEEHVRPDVAAVSVIAGATLVVFVPLAYVLTVALRQGLALLSALRRGELRNFVVDEIEIFGYVVDIDVLYVTYQEPINTAIQRLASWGLGLLRGIPDLTVGLSVTLFVLFTLLRDGDRLFAWALTVAPVSERVQRDLIAELDDLMWASVVGNVIVAGIQALLLGVGLFLLGVPGVTFLTVAAFVLTLLPLVGSFGVWVPLSLYLLVRGRTTAAVVLFVFGVLVSLSDTYLRPAVINRAGAINVAIIVVGIFGGIVLFGGVGLFVGPVALGGAKVVLDLYAREREAGATAVDRRTE